MYCFLALQLESYLQYNIDITTEQSFRYTEHTNAIVTSQKCVIILGFSRLDHMII